MMSTTEMLKREKEMRLLHYGVEDLCMDKNATMRRPTDEKRENMYGGYDEFHSPVIRWKIDGKWYAGAVPLALYKHDRSDWLGSLWHWQVDEFAMDMKLKEMIEKSRRGEVENGNR